MALTEDQPIRRFGPDGVEAMPDPIIAEARIELDINDGRYRLAMLCLPSDLEALAVGFLFGEGALRERDDLSVVEAQPDAGRVIIRGDFDEDVLEGITRRWTWGTGCGGGGTARDLDSSAYVPADPGPVVSAEDLHRLAKDFHSRAELWKRTGGVHACALADIEGVAVFAEDVGRHNAFDKVM
ncbi:hypothetical protein LCGC14_3125530, partial [marine sediment metagenome]